MQIQWLLKAHIFDIVYRVDAVQERIWIGDVSCEGSEEYIHECVNSGFGSAACNHSQDVGVVCERKVFIVK